MEEIGRLKHALENAVAGFGSTILIAGEAGVGKSRLVEAFKGVADKKNVNVLVGAADSLSARPFLVLSRSLGNTAGEQVFEEQQYTGFLSIFAINPAGILVAHVSSSDGKMDADIFAGMLSAVQNFVSDSLGKASGEYHGLGRLEYGDMKILIEHGKHLFLTGVFTGAEHPDMKIFLRRELRRIEEEHRPIIEKYSVDVLETRPIEEEIMEFSKTRFPVKRSLEGVKLENERIKISDRVLEVLKHVSEQKPVVLLLEDLHWADESSLFVIGYISRNIESLPILLLGTHRPEESAALQKTMEDMKKEGNVAELHLEKLGLEDTKVLVDSMFSPNDFPITLPEQMYAQSRGNPLFILEMLKGMFEEGSIVKSDGGYAMTSDAYHIPATIEDVVNRRLDLLDQDALAMVEYVSCIGQQFNTELAESTHLVRNPKISLDRLFDAGILIKRGRALEFSHAIVRSVIYQGIGERWKSGHHKNIGEYVEETHAGDMEGVIYDLARHFSRTREYEKSVEYCMKAAEKAESSFAVEQALEFYRIVLENLPKTDSAHDRDMVLRIKRRIAKCHYVSGEWEKAIENNKEAIALGQNMGSSKDVGQAYYQLSVIYEHMSKYDMALEMVGKGLEMLVQTGDSRAVAECYAEKSRIYWSMGSLEDALEHLLKGIEFAQEIADKSALGRLYDDLGNIQGHMGHTDVAEVSYSKSISLLEESHDLFELGRTLNNMGDTYLKQKDYKKALEYFQRQLDVTKKAGYLRGEGFAYANSAEAMAKTGDKEMISEAKDYCDKALRIFQKLGENATISMTYKDMGIVYSMGDEWENAEDCFKRSIEGIKESNFPYYQAEFILEFGMAHMRKGDSKKAVELIENARSIWEGLGSKSRVAEVDGILDDMKRHVP